MYMYHIYTYIYINIYNAIYRVARGNSGRGVIPVIEQYFFSKKYLRVI